MRGNNMEDSKVETSVKCNDTIDTGDTGFNMGTIATI